MSNSGESISTGELPALASLFSTLSLHGSAQPSASASPLPQQSVPPHQPLMPPKVDPDAVDFSAVFLALGTNPLHRNATGRPTTLNGSEDYNTWSHQTTTVFRFCGIDKVLTGEWAKPNVTLDDATSVTGGKGTWKPVITFREHCEDRFTVLRLFLLRTF